MKICVRCDEKKEFSEFHRKKASADGFQSACKQCVRSYRSSYYLKNKAHERESNRLWKQAHPDYIEWFRTDAGRMARKKNRTKARARVIAWFGGKCVYCNSTDTDALELDHVNGDGKQHREELFGVQKGCDMYQYLVANDMDTGGYELQLLCSDCHKQKTSKEKASRGRM